MMQTYVIFGLDWTGVQSYWMQQPWTDGGRLSYDRMDPSQWFHFFNEVGNQARATGMLLGIRGTRTDDTTLRNILMTALQTYRRYQFDDVGGSGYMPTVGPWFDTVGLPDLVNEPNAPMPGVKFDLANDAHIAIAKEQYIRPFFVAVRAAETLPGVTPIQLARSVRGRVLTAWHGIGPSMGYGYTNLHLSWRLLEATDQVLTELGLGIGDHIPDAGWVKDGLPHQFAYGVNAWFEGHGPPPKPMSLTNHGDVVVGVCVPSFADPHTTTYLIDPRGGATLDKCLQAMRASAADVVLIEGHTDTEESAALTTLAKSDGTPNDTMLKVLRRHMELTSTVPEPEPEPEPLPPTTGGPMIAVTNAPLYGTRVITGWLAGTLETNPNGSVCVKLETPLPGYPKDDGTPTGPYPYLSVQPSGEYQGRQSGDGGYESFKKGDGTLTCTYEHLGVRYIHVLALTEL